MIYALSYIAQSFTANAPPYLILGVASAFLSDSAYLQCWLQEFFGTYLMILLTFSPGKWIGVDSLPIAWLSHAAGVILSDYISGGPHVNPAVSLAMFSLGKASYTETYIRISGAMTSGLIAFPTLLYFSDLMNWEPLGGPTYSPTDENDDFTAAFFNEFFACFCLLFIIFLVNFEMHFGKWHYIVKQSLTAAGIRYLIEVFGLTGPAMNPMLGTSWAVFDSDGAAFPEVSEHYLVYWIAPSLGALTGSLLYAIYTGEKYFGIRLPGPIKHVEEVKQDDDKKKK